MYIVDTLGFETHMRNMRKQRGEAVPDAWYKRPYAYMLFLPRSKVKKSGEEILIPNFVEKPDYEFEIAAKFDEDFQTSDEKKAIEFVKTKMHFAIFNDLSAREHQASDMQLPLSVGPSKGICDKAFGEWSEARRLNFDDRGVPHLAMSLEVNDIARRHGVFHSIYFIDPVTGERKCWSFAQVIAWFGRLNQGFHKGTVLGSGTIGGGSIAEMLPKYPWLKDGDLIHMRADPLGFLENTVHIYAPD